MHKNSTIKTNFIAIFISLFASLFLLNFPSLAEENSSELSIVIKGNERVDRDTILSYLVKSNTNLAQKQIDESLKNLYQSDLFSDVKIYPQEISQTSEKRAAGIIIEVTENPIISEVKFIGNKKQVKKGGSTEPVM